MIAQMGGRRAIKRVAQRPRVSASKSGLLRTLKPYSHSHGISLFQLAIEVEPQRVRERESDKRIEKHGAECKQRLVSRLVRS